MESGPSAVLVVCRRTGVGSTGPVKQLEEILLGKARKWQEPNQGKISHVPRSPLSEGFRTTPNNQISQRARYHHISFWRGPPPPPRRNTWSTILGWWRTRSIEFGTANPERGSDRNQRLRDRHQRRVPPWVESKTYSLNARNQLECRPPPRFRFLTSYFTQAPSH